MQSIVLFKYWRDKVRSGSTIPKLLLTPHTLAIGRGSLNIPIVSPSFSIVFDRECYWSTNSTTSQNVAWWRVCQRRNWYIFSFYPTVHAATSICQTLSRRNRRLTRCEGDYCIHVDWPITSPVASFSTWTLDSRTAWPLPTTKSFKELMKVKCHLPDDRFRSLDAFFRVNFGLCSSCAISLATCQELLTVEPLCLIMLVVLPSTTLLLCKERCSSSEQLASSFRRESSRDRTFE